MLDDLCMWWMLLLGVQGSEQDAGVGGGGAVASALGLPTSYQQTLESTMIVVTENTMHSVGVFLLTCMMLQ